MAGPYCLQCHSHIPFHLKKNGGFSVKTHCPREPIHHVFKHHRDPSAFGMDTVAENQPQGSITSLSSLFIPSGLTTGGVTDTTMTTTFHSHSTTTSATAYKVDDDNDNDGFSSPKMTNPGHTTSISTFVSSSIEPTGSRSVTAAPTTGTALATAAPTTSSVAPKGAIDTGKSWNDR